MIHPRVLALSGGLLAVAAGGVCWPWLTARGVRVVVGFDRGRAVEGEPVGTVATVTNHLPWPAWGLVIPSGGHPIGEEPSAAVRFGAIPARSRVDCRWSFITPGRGEYPAETPVVSTSFPFGVWEAGRAARVEGRLLAWPRTFPVGPVPVAAGDDATEGAVVRCKVGSTGDVIGVRPYRRGDSPRRIHWRQSAKHDRLVVCELHSTSRPVVVLALDADPAVHTPGPNGSREWAIRVFASLASGWLEQGAQIGAAWAGTYIPPASGSAQRTKVLDGLARLEDDCRGSLADVLGSPAVRAARSAVRVLVSTDAGESRTRSRGHDGWRWVVLERSGFGGAPGRDEARGCDEGPIRARPRPWLAIANPGRVADRLRHGWAEAKHGS